VSSRTTAAPAPAAHASAAGRALPSRLPLSGCRKLLRTLAQTPLRPKIPLLPLLLAGLTIPAAASPATFVTALPVARDQALVRLNFQPQFGSSGFHSLQFPINIGYGLTPRWALFVNLNQGFLSLDQPSPQSTGGAGDLVIFARNTLFKVDKPRSTFRIAPFAGLYAPTGNNHQLAAGRLAPGPLQSGSGTFDPYVGLTSGFNNTRFGAASDVTFRHNPVTSTGFSPGDQFRADGQVEVTFYPLHFPRQGLPNLFVLSIESNYEQDADHHENGTLAPSSSSRLFKQDAVFELATLHWEIGLGAQLPLMQSFAAPGQLREHSAFYTFFEYYLSTPSWRHPFSR
jgi:hypothetical protein